MILTQDNFSVVLTAATTEGRNLGLISHAVSPIFFETSHRRASLGTCLCEDGAIRHSPPAPTNLVEGGCFFIGRRLFVVPSRADGEGPHDSSATTYLPRDPSPSAAAQDDSDGVVAGTVNPSAASQPTPGRVHPS